MKRKTIAPDNPVYLWRKRKRLSTADVATKLGVAKSTVISWESGVSVPTDDNLEPLAKMMGVRYNALLIQLQAGQRG